MKVKFLLLILACFITSCTALKVKREYDDAIEHIEDEDYDSAIDCLQKTIDLCPQDAKYYHTIANVYFEKGDLENSWIYCRKTLQCPNPPDEAFFMFEQIFGMMCAKYKILAGMSEEELVAKFGDPDKVIVAENPEQKAFIYGISLFYLKWGFISEAFFRGNPEPWDPIDLEVVSFPRKKQIPCKDL